MQKHFNNNSVSATDSLLYKGTDISL